MRRFIFGFFAVIGSLVFAVILLGAGLWIWVRVTEYRVVDNTVLTLDLTAAFPDAPPSGRLQSLVLPERRPLRDVLDGLERAGGDPRVKGLVARIGDGSFGLAQIQELRDAVAAFRARGKFAIAYSDSFGEFGSGTRSYYLATGFDEIWLQPMGLLGLIGLRAETPFFRGTLDKLGLVPRFDQREEFKTAMNTLTESAMTPAHREETESILASVYRQIVGGIAADRKLDPGTVRALVDRGPLMTEEAVAAHLIDHIGYWDEAIAAIRARLGGGIDLLSLARYLDAAGEPHSSGPTVALIYASGLIARGGGSGPLGGSGILGANKVIEAFRKAQRDPAVRAILFRIDSPGGSAVASESIWRAVGRAKAAGKPVIVSMGDVAGSGGYYIAAGADKIVAEPATLTGSIGVLAGKMLITGLSDKLGMSWDSAQIGSNAAMFSPIEDFSKDGHARFESFLDEVYAGFKERVAEGRKLDAAAIETVAKGRVWTGEEAQARGLVDALGGYATALDLAKQAAGIPASSDVTIELFPPPSDTARALIARALGGGEDEDSNDGGSSSLAAALALLQPLVEQLQLLASPPGALVMPPLELH
ncbi:MAG TPA: signal peptide peptidase SppA [Stellaceae bacterium]|nr:signal peptide peptidase SppA [Stellaceae bacterium]